MSKKRGRSTSNTTKKREEYARTSVIVRRGIGVAAFWYNTAVYPISLETSSNRMLPESRRHGDDAVR